RYGSLVIDVVDGQLLDEPVDRRWRVGVASAHAKALPAKGVEQDGDVRGVPAGSRPELLDRTDSDGELRCKAASGRTERLRLHRRAPLSALQLGERLAGMRLLRIGCEDAHVVSQMPQVLTALQFYEHVREMFGAAGVHRADHQGVDIWMHPNIAFKAV